MYSFLSEATADPAESYDWFTYTKEMPVAVNANLRIENGTRFGVRRFDIDPTKVRLVLHGNLARVFTVNMEVARALAKGIRNERSKR